MAKGPVFLYAAAYDSADDARLDYGVLLEAHAEGWVGTYDAAVLEKTADGKVHVHKHEKPTQHGAWAESRSVPRRHPLPAVNPCRRGRRRGRRGRDRPSEPGCRGRTWRSSRSSSTRVRRRSSSSPSPGSRSNSRRSSCARTR